MRKVIVGVEESEQSRDALRFGCAFAESEGAELHVASVLPFESAAVDPAEREELHQRHFDRVFELVDRALGEQPYVPHRIDGLSAAAGLTELSQNIDADAIVIGSTRHGPIGRVLLGDVGTSLTAGAECPVFVAPRGYSRDDHARIDRIGVGFDGTAESELALSEAIRIAKRHDARLRLIGVVPRLLAPARIGHTDRGFQQLLVEELAKRLEDAAGTDSVDAGFVIEIGDAADELTEASRDLDLLVLGSRGYGPVRRVLLGGVSAEVMRSAACPVTVVPRGDEPGPSRDQIFSTLVPFAI